MLALGPALCIKHAYLVEACATAADAYAALHTAAHRKLRETEAVVTALAHTRGAFKAALALVRVLREEPSISVTAVLELYALAIAIDSARDGRNNDGGDGGDGDDSDGNDGDVGTAELASAVTEAVLARGDASVGFLGPFADAVAALSPSPVLAGQPRQSQQQSSQQQSKEQSRQQQPQQPDEDENNAEDGWGIDDDDDTLDLAPADARSDASGSAESDAALDDSGRYDELQLRLGVSDLVSEALERIVAAASSARRDVLKHHRDLVATGGATVRLRPLLAEVLETVLDPADNAGLGDVSRGSFSLAGLLSSGFSRFGFGRRQPRPADYSTLVLFVVGGVAAHEIALAASIAERRGITLIVGSTAVGGRPLDPILGVET
jgi:hypothetical protein